MTPEENDAIRQCVEAMNAINPDVAFAAVLVGSVARGTSTDRSDVDIVFVSEHRLRRPRYGERIHAQVFLVDELRERLRAGDDFALWCVRFGMPITNNGIWKSITSDANAARWPEWRRKQGHAARRLSLASELFRAGDLAAASEEALYAATHAGRAILLQAGVFPCSRPEIVGQLTKIGRRPLAECLRRLLDEGEDGQVVYRTVRYLKRMLIGLDRIAYAQWAGKRARDAARRRAARANAEQALAVADDALDVELAERRLREVDEHPETAVSGDALDQRLRRLLS